MAQAPTITPVILCGGAGTRLWPASRSDRPKQLLALLGDETLLQQSMRRTLGQPGYASPLIVTAAAQAGAIDAQLAVIGAEDKTLVLEPAARGTAPAIALAALAVDPDALLLVMPSDHAIGNVAALHAAVALAAPLAVQDWLVTFGIEPTGPETGYGWIKAGSAISDGIDAVDRFIEKPPLDHAEAMLAAGGHYWNGGIFLLRAGAYLAALQRYAPAMLTAARAAMDAARREPGLIAADGDAFAASPADSIDYAVMEKAERVAVVPVDMAWSDIGSWDALYALRSHDAAGNALTGAVEAIDSNGCLVDAGEARVALLGVSDLIVVVSGNDIVVMPRGRSQEMRRVAEAMQRR